MKSLLVLGASSEIGCSFLRASANEYDRVYAHYSSSPDRVEGCRNVLGDRLIPLQADFRDPVAVKSMAESFSEAPTHILYLPAPGFENRKFHKINYEEFQLGFDIGVRGAVIVLQKLLPKMVKNGGGKVVFMLTDTIIPPVPKYCAQYVTVKYAMLGLMRALDAEYGHQGININAVSPWIVDTRFINAQLRYTAEQYIANGQMSRYLAPEEVGDVIRFLFSDAGNNISGQNLSVSPNGRDKL